MDILSKASGKTSEVNLDSGVSQKEWEIFLEVKDQLDKILIDHIRTKLSIAVLRVIKKSSSNTQNYSTI